MMYSVCHSKLSGAEERCANVCGWDRVQLFIRVCMSVCVIEWEGCNIRLTFKNCDLFSLLTDGLSTLSWETVG